MIEASETARPAPAAVIPLRRPGTRARRIFRAAIALYILGAAAASIASLVLAETWLKHPFLGAFYDSSLEFVSAAPIGEADAWHLQQQVEKPGSRLIAISGSPVHTSAEAALALSRFGPGQDIPLTIRARDGTELAVDAKLGSFGFPARLAYVYLPLVAGLISIVVSLWILAASGFKSSGRAISLLSASLGIAASLFFDQLTTHALTPVWLLSVAIAGSALLHLATVFPRESPLPERLPLAPWLFYLAALGLFAFALPRLVEPTSAVSSTAAGGTIYAFAAFSAVVYILVNVYYGTTKYPPVVNARGRMITAASLLATGPLLLWSVFSASGNLAFTPYLIPPIALLPVTLAYAAQRFSFGGSANWLRQGAVYGLLTFTILGAYALMIAGLSLVLGTAMPAVSPLWIAGMAIIFAVLLQPIQTRLQAIADRTFFRGHQAASAAVQAFTKELANAPNLEAVARVVREVAQTALAPAAVHVFAYDALNDQYVAVRDEAKRPSTDIVFPAQGALVNYFIQNRPALLFEPNKVSLNLQADHSRLALLGAQLLLALPGQERPLGWLALGQRISGTPYAPADMPLLEQLADQTSIAIHRLQSVENLKRRIDEMDALARVARGVNITLTFNDVLELIYAQTARILPFSHFYIALHGREADHLYLAFAVEGKERLTVRENTPLPPNVGLERDVIRRGRPLITPNYDRECKSLGVSPLAQGVAPWMSVPLNAGAESIGALSIGSGDAGAVYTPGQLELLQAVADQTAGAIVKTRLLKESQQRAAQLSQLNELTRQLASTLETDRLRQIVVDGATSLLDCAAGVFYTLDQPTGDLVVRALSGSLPNDMMGQHVPAGTTNAARTMASRGTSIDNGLPAGSGMAIPASQSAPFIPRTSLAVPLQVQDSNLGILEVMNRRDGGPFVPEDQSLLTAFAGQAAAALENVRLYTLTDQELAARVEELSIMQRIDRELNASLETDRAMHIALEWALRQSSAEAGLIGLLEEGRLHVLAQMGYDTAPGGAADQTADLTLPGFQLAVDTGLPQRVQFQSANMSGFLPGADHQVVVPIRREAAVIGLLVLESTTAGQEDLGFLSRLSDHAAIAIFNAQLYDEVQKANIAKSDFVSLVAHELKNPMTSIKGYTELLAAGAVGPVNEMQANFLNTIHSNTERMSTLVSDLNDNSKIEAGRLRLDFKSVELSEVIDEVLRSTRRQIEEKQQSVQMELHEHLPAVWADATRLGQVFTNLVSNANKYTHEGGTLVVGAEPSSNHWDPEGAGRVVHVWLRDNGIGISPEDQQRIFQKFFRSEDPKAREVPGAGLGLNITRSLVEMQGGRIWFESEYRHGTTFHFTVPVAEA